MTDTATYGFPETSTSVPVVELKEFVVETTDTVSRSAHQIVFMVKGSMHMALNNSDAARPLVRGEFVFLPAGCSFSCLPFEQSTVLIARLTGEMPEWYVSRINRLSAMTDGSAGPENIRSLTVNECMQGAVDGLRTALANDITDEIYLRLKVQEILFLIHSCYLPQQCIEFFSTIVSPDFRFSEFVRSNWMKRTSVGELADGLNMSAQQFANRFRKVFGTCPHLWLQRQKAWRIYHELRYGNKPLKVIADDFGFSVQSNFIRFCRKNFGASPSKVRGSQV